MKHWEMAKDYANDERVRFFVGDVRDKDRLSRALKGIDYVVHAAATKIVPTAEYNPFECVKTNVIGAMNLIDACIDQGVSVSLHFRPTKPVAQSICMVQQNSPPTNCLLQVIHMQEKMTLALQLSGTETSWDPVDPSSRFFCRLLTARQCQLPMSA
jgi:UDP-glucose 4-epimerase